MKYTEEYVRNLCDKKDLKFVNIETKFIDGKNRRCLNFICNKHHDFGVQTKAVEKMESAKKPCIYCNHKNLKKNFKEEVAKKDNNITVIGEYVNWDTSILCECKIHKYQWYGLPSVLLNGGGCKECANKKRWDTRGRKTTEIFQNELKNVNELLEVIGEYNGNKTPIQCRCKKHLIIFAAAPSNLLNKNTNCPKCALEHIRSVESHSSDYLTNKIKEYELDIELIGEYVNNKTKTKFRCLKHDIEFEMLPKTILYNQGCGCPMCIQSNGEKKMLKILTSFFNAIKAQYSFENCKYKSKLRFDAYEEDKKIAFEYQGQQHYYPVNFGGMSDKEAQLQFEEGQKRDAIKRKYCIDNNIKLIEIPYWKYDEMEEFIKNNLKDVLCCE